MSEIFKKAKLIYPSNLSDFDEWTDYYTEFDYDGGLAICHVSVETNYTLYINGTLVSFGQYDDYPEYKVVDEIDVTKFLVKGKNKLALIHWRSCCDGGFCYYPGVAGVIFEIESNGKVLCASDEKVASRFSPAYAQWKKRIITGQIGYTFSYDATKEDDFINRGFWGQSVVKENNNEYFLRPIPSLVLKDRINSTIMSQKQVDVVAKTYQNAPLKPEYVAEQDTTFKPLDDTHYIVDLGEQKAGFVCMSFESETEQDVLVTWGEHLADGKVRQVIGARDFSLYYRAKSGLNEYINTFLRLGGRYIELSAQKPIKLNYLSLRPTDYPVEKVEYEFCDEITKRIYDTCVRTLHLCMHEHYEDTPWREQSMYAMDSRNQMLCGYTAFKTSEFQRAALVLMSKGMHGEDLLDITFPTNSDLRIPSFSLVYPIMVDEYVEHTGDISLIEEVMPAMTKIINRFKAQIQPNGLVSEFPAPCWNFYEWIEGSDNWSKLKEKDSSICSGIFDLNLNAFYIMALDSCDRLSQKLGKTAEHTDLIKSLRQKCYDAFFDKDQGLFLATTEEKYRFPTELCNGLAVLAGIVSNYEAKIVLNNVINSNQTRKSTLSMVGWFYDALIRTDNCFDDYVLSDVYKNYSYMLDIGATTFWETIYGERDFGGAGSLSHGWSAMPVYYFDKLGKIKKARG